jgi:hypothetical protein
MDNRTCWYFTIDTVVKMCNDSCYSLYSWNKYCISAAAILLNRPLTKHFFSTPILFRAVRVVLLRLSCPSCPVLIFTTVLPALSCSDHFVLSIWSRLTYQDYLFCLSCTGCPVPDDCPGLSCPGCPVMASCNVWPVTLFLSWLFSQVVLPR